MKTGLDTELIRSVIPQGFALFLFTPHGRVVASGRAILQRCEKSIQLAGFRSVELVATLAGVPFYGACNYSQGERFEVPLSNGLTLPVVRMVKRFR
jgi:hypothetical protein